MPKQVLELLAPNSRMRNCYGQAEDEMRAIIYLSLFEDPNDNPEGRLVLLSFDRGIDYAQFEEVHANLSDRLSIKEHEEELKNIRRVCLKSWYARKLKALERKRLFPEHRNHDAFNGDNENGSENGPENGSEKVSGNGLGDGLEEEDKDPPVILSQTAPTCAKKVDLSTKGK